jgi:hypothetical protein
VLVGRDEATLKPVLKSLSQREGSNHESRVGDTGERRFWENLIKEVVSESWRRSRISAKRCLTAKCGYMCQCCRCDTLQLACHDQSSVDRKHSEDKPDGDHLGVSNDDQINAETSKR